MLSQVEESFENGKVRVCYEKDMTEYAVNWIGAEKLRAWVYCKKKIIPWDRSICTYDFRGGCTATAVPFIYSFSGNCAASAPIYIFPGSVHIFPPAEKADPSWEYIIRSQTH